MNMNCGVFMSPLDDLTEYNIRRRDSRVADLEMELDMTKMRVADLERELHETMTKLTSALNVSFKLFPNLTSTNLNLRRNARHANVDFFN